MGCTAHVTKLNPKSTHSHITATTNKSMGVYIPPQKLEEQTTAGSFLLKIYSDFQLPYLSTMQGAFKNANLVSTALPQGNGLCD